MAAMGAPVGQALRARTDRLGPPPGAC
jgi:hypothetical protein